MKLYMMIMLVGLVGVVSAWAEQAPPAPPTQQCPEDNAKRPPGDNPSDRLAETKGVICPPKGIDPDIAIKPPSEGTIKVVPAPGTPGGDPSVQPK